MPTVDEWVDHLKVLTAPREPWKPGEYCDRCQNTAPGGETRKEEVAHERP